jgi:hypothetical protein
MSRCAPWTAATSFLLALLVVISAGVSTGESARGRADRDDDGEERGAADDGTRSITGGLECDACHDQTSFKMVSRSGASGPFDHDRTGFPLKGRHRELGCMECHAGGRTINGECAGCHADPHRGGLGNDCDRCHTNTSFRIVRAYEIHEQTGFPLTGRHASADCTECHLRNGERRFTGVPSDCFACHEDDYRRPDVHPVHAGTSTTPPFPRDCAQCHRPTGWSPAIVDPTALPGRDALTSAESHDDRFPLSYGPHRGASCDSCHASTTVRRAVRCTGCHAHDPARLRATHGARLVSFSGSACLACHRNGSVP